MADLSKTIDIILNGRDKASPSIKSVNDSIGDLSGKVQNATQPMANMHDAVLKLEAAFGLLAVGGLALSIKAFTDWQDQTGEISTLLNETGQSVDDFKEDIKSYAQTSTASIQDINSAIYSAISAGVDYQDALGSLAQAEELATAGRADLNDSLKLVVSTLNAYGEGADQASKYADIFFQTVKEGQTTIPELASSLSKVTGLAANAGVDIEELAAAIAALTASGAPTTEAITGIRGAISNILKPTQQAKDAADELGIEFGAAALESKGFKGVLDEVYEATNGNTEEMTKFFGRVQGLNAALVLAGSNSDKFADSLDSMENSTGAVSEAFEKMAENISQANQTLVNNVQLTLISVGEEIEGEYADLVGSVSEIFKGLQVGIDEGAFDEVFDVINSFGSDLTEQLETIAKNLPEALGEVDFSGFATSVEDLLGSLGDLIQALFQEDLSTTEGLANAIQKVTNGIQTLTEITTGIVDAWEPWFELLGNTLEKITSFDTETNKAIGSTLQLGKVVNELSGFVGSLSGAFDAVRILMVTLTTKTIVDMVGGLKGIKGAVGSATTALGGLQGAAGKAIGSTAGKAGLLGIAYAAGHGVGTILNDHVPAVTTASQAILGWVDSLIDFSGTQEAADRQTASFGRTVEAIASNIDKFDADLSGLRGELSALGHDMENVPDDMVIRMAAEADLLSFDEIQEILRTRIPEERKTNILVDDQGTAEETGKRLDENLPDEKKVGVTIDDNDTTDDIIAQLNSMQGKEVEVKTDDKGSIDETAQEIEDKIPAEKKLELETDLKMAQLEKDMAEIESRTEVMNTAMEWTAKVNIKDAEASMEKFKSAMEAANITVSDMASSTSDLFAIWFGEGNQSFTQQWAIEDAIDQQQRIQEQAAEDQHRLIQEQIRMMQAKREAMESGEGIINITTDGLEPELEAFMWKIIERVQVRANEEASEFLLGINS
jgi:TP901 family phage tail tape measure protein